MLSKEDVRHLAELARIRIPDEKIEAFLSDLSSIIDFVAVLQKEGASDVRPMSGGTEGINVFREDEATAPLGDPEDLQSTFLKSDAEGYLIVPKVFDRSE